MSDPLDPIADQVEAEHQKLALFERRKKLRRHYRELFQGEHSEAVMADLSQFSGIDRDCFHPDSDRITSYNLGGRRVVLRIRDFMTMSDEDLWALRDDDTPKSTSSEVQGESQ